MKVITDRQKEVLTFISEFTEDNAFPPTVREISEHFDISLRAVQDHIAALQKKGYLPQCKKRSRSIRVLSDIREKEQKLFVGKENWHHGVIGIVASKITEIYYKPTILICIEDGNYYDTWDSGDEIPIYYWKEK